MKCCSLKDVEQEIISQLKSQNLYPVIGAGFTRGHNAKKGIAPSGDELLQEMLTQIQAGGHNTDSIKSKDLKTVAKYYKNLVNRNLQTNYLMNVFTGIELPDYQKNFLAISWKYIYSFNIDNAIESNSKYTNVILPNRNGDENVIQDIPFCLFKIHGDVVDYCKYPDSNCYIFDTEEYAKSIKSNTYMLNKMNHDFSYNNLMFVGCSLTDELDILSLSNTKLIPENTSRYYITTTQPDTYKTIDLETYGITHVIIVDDYMSFYKRIHQLFLESQKIQTDELEKYQNIKVNFLDKEYDSNLDYLYMGKMIYTAKTNSLNFPYFFVDRDIIKKELIAEMDIYSLQFICGGRISGKSYALALIPKIIKNRNVFFFDSRYSINNTSLNNLLQRENSILCFDTGCLTKDQIHELRNNIDILKSKKINIILCINLSDKDILTALQYNLNSNIKIYSLENKFNNSEKNDINSKLSILTMSHYKSGKTILDNLLEISEVIGVTYKKNRVQITASNKYEMAVLILLAIKERLSSQEFVDFSIEKEIHEIYKKVTPILDEDYTNSFERTTLNSSTYKIYANSKYWLFSKLGEYAADYEKHKLITDAYRHIIDKLIQNHSPKYGEIEDYIKYDIINEIFFKPERGNLRLMKAIYDELNDLLANNAQFFHQRAKCYLWHCRYSDEPLNEINEALRFAKVSLKNSTPDDGNIGKKLAISIAHIDFTIALIYAKKNKLLKYEDISCFKEALLAIRKILYNPYNKNDLQRLMRTKSREANDIRDYIDYAMTQDLTYLKLNAGEKHNLDELITFRMNVNMTK